MTRNEAVQAIYEVINSGIIDAELEETLTEVCSRICEDDWEKCEVDERCANGLPNYCEGCPYQEEYEYSNEDEETDGGRQLRMTAEGDIIL